MSQKQLVEMDGEKNLSLALAFVAIWQGTNTLLAKLGNAHSRIPLLSVRCLCYLISEVRFHIHEVKEFRQSLELKVWIRPKNAVIMDNVME